MQKQTATILSMKVLFSPTTNRATLIWNCPVRIEYFLCHALNVTMSFCECWHFVDQFSFCCLLHKNQEVQPLHLQGSLQYESWRAVISDEDQAALDLNNLNWHWHVFTTYIQFSESIKCPTPVLSFQVIVRERVDLLAVKKKNQVNWVSSQVKSLYKIYKTWWIQIHSA